MSGRERYEWFYRRRRKAWGKLAFGLGMLAAALVIAEGLPLWFAFAGAVMIGVVLASAYRDESGTSREQS